MIKQTAYQTAVHGRPFGMIVSDGHIDTIFFCCGSGEIFFLPLINLSKKGRHFTDDVFICIFVNEKFCILIKSSLKFVPMGPIESSLALV